LIKAREKVGKRRNSYLNIVGNVTISRNYIAKRKQSIRTTIRFASYKYIGVITSAVTESCQEFTTRHNYVAHGRES
jgi:hypothetical protein